MTDRIEELEIMCATVHFALNRLWIREFKREPNPAVAARTYTDELSQVFSDSEVPQYSDELLAFFEQIASELRGTTLDG